LRCRKLGEATCTAQTAAAVAAALAAGTPAQQQLQELQEVLQQLLLQQRGDATAVKPAAAVAAADSTAAAVLPGTQQGDSTAASPMESDSDNNGLPLPAQLLQAVVCCCDSRTAAAVAVSCKQLHMAVAAQQFLQVSSALQMHLAAVNEASRSYADVGVDGESDEASQADSSFVGQFPLDGSAVAGAGLVGVTGHAACSARVASFQYVISRRVMFVVSGGAAAAERQGNRHGLEQTNIQVGDLELKLRCRSAVVAELQ
jgi:hypothetical protein